MRQNLPWIISVCPAWNHFGAWCPSVRFGTGWLFEWWLAPWGSYSAKGWTFQRTRPWGVPCPEDIFEPEARYQVKGLNWWLCVVPLPIYTKQFGGFQKLFIYTLRECLNGFFKFLTTPPVACTFHYTLSTCSNSIFFYTTDEQLKGIHRNGMQQA